ncbi:DUF3768 domain-containing protein [Sphingomonas sp. XXL09]|uniref:DUF3768 domain-containing protein n=1 Tax=Sphingomonas sp. XXL09 TaxID=3457787 RepID=UPI00406BD97F
MTARERKTCARETFDQAERRTRIRELNDGLRRFARSGVICLTAGVQALGESGVAEALIATRDFDAFTPDNDPYDEHDFGAFRAAGERIFWKIDYYDRNRRYGSPDPADPRVTIRVLTIMLASEY